MEPPFKKQKVTHTDVVTGIALRESQVVGCKVVFDLSQDIAKSVPEIGTDEIATMELLGEGSFGKVYRGKCRGQEVVSL